MEEVSIMYITTKCLEFILQKPPYMHSLYTRMSNAKLPEIAEHGEQSKPRSTAAFNTLWDIYQMEQHVICK